VDNLSRHLETKEYLLVEYLKATQKMGAFYHGTNLSAGSTKAKKAPYDRV